MIRTCPQCSVKFVVLTGDYRRAMKLGAPLYCGRACSGLARRRKNPPSPEEAKAMKSAYDKARREKLAEEIKAKKREYFRRTYDPDAARIVRKQRMHLHVAYCRRPEYQAKKADYDLKYRAKEFGEYADAYLALHELGREIAERATRYEIGMTNGTINKAHMRRRDL